MPFLSFDWTSIKWFQHDVKLQQIQKGDLILGSSDDITHLFIRCHSPKKPTKMELQQHCNCKHYDPVAASPTTKDAISWLSNNPKEDSKDDSNNLRTANANSYEANKFSINQINDKQKCISSYLPHFHFPGELRNRYWHHRWRRRLVSHPWRRWQMMIEDEFPFVSLCLPTGFKQNPSSQDGLVKLSSLMTIMIFALLSAFIFSNWLYFGACMIVRLLFIQLSLLLPVLVSQVDLRLIVFNQLTTMLVKCEKYFVKNCLKNIVDFVNMTMKYIVYLYSIVKKTVVVETVSKSAGTTKNSTKACNYNLFSRCTKSSVVLLSYATLIAISQSTGKHHFQIYMS